MHSLVLPLIASFWAASVRAQAQGPPPSPVLLTTTKSGVLPVLPPGFTGVETEEGAITYDGPMNPGFAGLNGPAVAQTNIPTATYVATLPKTMFDPYAGSNISGTITGVGTDQGVQFTVNIQGLPNPAYGPFVYHVHGMAVPADGNCTSTMGHLDPTDRGEYYPCDMTQPQTCQAGDLAGKHGNITSMTFTTSYMEPYLSTDPSSAYFFGDKSIVIHTSNTTRLTCANFAKVSNSTSSTSTPINTASSTGTSVTTISSPTAVATAGAGALVAGVAGLAAAGFAALLVL